MSDTLLDRLRKATGPDRELDAAVWKSATEAEVWNYDDNCHIDALIKSGAYRGARHLHPDYTEYPAVTWRYRIGDAEYGVIPDLTASIDAALALVERILPTAIVDLSQLTGGHNWQARLTGGSYCIEEGAHTLPLAILIALLSARESDA